MKFKFAPEKLVLLPIVLGALLTFQNCSPVAFDEQPLSSFENPTSDPPGNAPEKKCTFNGKKYLEGQAITTYLTANVPSGKKCQSEVRRCQNGIFTGTYTFESCSTDPEVKIPCSWYGEVVPDGEWVKGYAVSVIGDKTSGEGFIWSPIAEKRTCTRGVLSGTFKCRSFDQLLGNDCTVYYWWDEIPKDTVRLEP